MSYDWWEIDIVAFFTLAFSLQPLKNKKALNFFNKGLFYFYGAFTLGHRHHRWLVFVCATLPQLLSS